MSGGDRRVTTAITAALSAEQARELLRAIIEETPLAIYAKDTGHRFLLSNRQHASLTARPSEEILGRTDAELFGEEGAVVDAASGRVLETGEHATHEFELTLADGAHTFLETIFPLAGDDGRVLGIGGIAADITSRRRLELALAERARELETTLAALRAAQEQLVRQQKMAALGGLVAGVAHEVSSPLGVALTASSLFEGYISELEGAFAERRLSRRSMTESLDRMRQAAVLTVRNLERSAKLLHAFKQVAVDRAQFLLREGFLGAWLDEVVTSLSPTMRQHGVRVEVTVDAPRPVVFAASELQQVVTNLLVNAAVHGFDDDDAAAPGHAPPPPRERVVRVSLRALERGVELVVADNGRGMTAAVAARVFDPFFTTRRGRGGTGLGLHVTHALVTETFQGCLAVETEPGGGARFVVAIPWRAETCALAAP